MRRLLLITMLLGLFGMVSGCVNPAMAITVIRAMDTPLTPMDGMVEATIRISDTTMIGRIIMMAAITIRSREVALAVAT